MLRRLAPDHTTARVIDSTSQSIRKIMASVKRPLPKLPRHCAGYRGHHSNSSKTATVAPTGPRTFF
eukprot:1170692-Pyramimonas_sp.AAC.1